VRKTTICKNRSTIPFVVPLELIKCNQQINFQGKTKKENRFIKKTQHIYRLNGLSGFYKGFWSTVNRDILSYGMYFLTYYAFKDYFKKKYFEFKSIHEAIAGASAGVIVWAVTYPFDTVKTIIQTAPLRSRTRKQFHVLKELWSQGGIQQLYRGATPSLLYSATFSAFMFVFFELSKNTLSKR
jgi:solute carrier family 25 carnitine/acylcarnitine transporter 20/29